MRLYKYIQKDIQQENIQYQDLVEYNTGSEGHPVYPSKKSIIRNYLDAMDFYTPTDTDYACRYRILTKIINKYYNYELFTDNYEYFGNRMLWRLNKIMPTYRAKFNSLLAQNGYESIWQNGLLWEHREGTRDTKRPEKDTNNHPVNFDRTDLADTTTTVGYNSDYPQVIVDSDHDYNATGDKTTTGRSGNDTVTHAMQENVGYGEDITRKFSPEEIAKAKLLFAQLIFNIDEEIVNAVADLFVLVDYPFEDDFDVAIQMSILDDAKAYTNLKFNESKAYTDQEVAKAKEIVYIPYDSSTPHSEIYTAIAGAVSNGKLPILKDTYNDKLWYLMDFTSGIYEFANGIDWVKYDYLTTTTGFYIRPELFKCIYNQTTFAEITQALSDGKLPYCVFTTGEYFYYYLAIGNTKYRFTESYIRETGVTYFIDVDNTNQWGIVPVSLEVKSNKATSISASSTDAQYPSAKATYDYVYGVEQSIYQAIGNSYQTLGNLVTSWGNPTSDSKYPSEKLVKDTIDGIAVFYDIVDVTWNDIASAKNNGKTIYLYTELGTGIKLYWYLDAYLPNTNNDGMARFVQIGGNQQFDIDYQDNQSISETLDYHELYICTYNTTTDSQVAQALTDGKIPVVKYQGDWYYYSGTASTSYVFTYCQVGELPVQTVFLKTVTLLMGYNTWNNSTDKLTTLKTEQLTLLSASWDANNEQALSSSLALMGATSIWVSPSGDPSAYASSGIYLASVSLIGSVETATFKCTSVPSTDITVNIVVG